MTNNCHKGLRSKTLHQYMRYVIINAREGYVQNPQPIYEVWNNMCDSGLRAKSLHQYMRYGLIIVADGKKKEKAFLNKLRRLKFVFRKE
ncbi:unknown [Clostridium sp. CAG:715]|nr:unknown [Clostridium sp. CAG:715]